MTPEERRAEAFKALIAKARDNELTSSEITDCLRGLTVLNGSGSARITLSDAGNATVTVGAIYGGAKYVKQCAEDALIAAHDDITRIIAEDAA